MAQVQQNKEKQGVKDLPGHERDPGAWTEEDQSSKSRRPRTTVLSLRVPADEWDALEASARGARESLSDYVRRAIEYRRTRRHPAGTYPAYLQATSGGGQFHIITSGSNLLGGFPAEAPETVTFDKISISTYDIQDWNQPTLQASTE